MNISPLENSAEIYDNISKNDHMLTIKSLNIIRKHIDANNTIEPQYHMWSKEAMIFDEPLYTRDYYSKRLVNTRTIRYTIKIPSGEISVIAINNPPPLYNTILRPSSPITASSYIFNPFD